ncbi:hypothetical protein L873DRAFT_1821264, partial [Choiromyces venosus 120613-1]
VSVSVYLYESGGAESESEAGIGGDHHPGITLYIYTSTLQLPHTPLPYPPPHTLHLSRNPLLPSPPFQRSPNNGNTP